MADTLPQIIQDMVLGSALIDSALASYPPDGTPALFQGRAPSDHAGFPYIVFKLDELAPSSEQNSLKRIITLQFDVWDLNAGHSYAAIQPIIRELTEIFDFQRIGDTADYEAVRSFLTGTSSIESPGEEDNKIQMMSLFTILAYRKYMQTILTRM